MFAEFSRLCELTLYSRAERDACRQGYDEEIDSVTRARHWFTFVRSRSAARS